MDKDTERALVSILEMPQQTIQMAADARIFSLRTNANEALLKAHIPCYRGVFESGEYNLIRKPTGVKDKPSLFVDARVLRLRLACAR